MGELDHDRVGAGSGGAERDASTSLFLALYLLLLAFFIMLNAISSFEVVKSQKVMDSLSSTFKSLTAEQSNVQFSAQLGDVVAAREFLGEAQDMFETAIPASRVEIIEPGELMQVTLHADALFMPESTEIRPAQNALLDRVVASLAGAPEGVRYVMEFQIGSDYSVGTHMPIGETLQVARAGAFAREAIKRGAPPTLVLVGIKHGDPFEVRISFRVVNDNAARLTFGDDRRP